MLSILKVRPGVPHKKQGLTARLITDAVAPCRLMNLYRLLTFHNPIACISG